MSAPFAQGGRAWLVSGEWKRWNSLQKCTWLWVHTNIIIEKQKPDLTVRFEDIFLDKKRKGLRKIFEVIEEEYDSKIIEKGLEKKINLPKNELMPKFEDWPEIWKKQFWEIAKEQMKKYGYTK